MPHNNSPKPLAGKVALITGAARRVGKAIALELGAKGADIAVHYRTSKDEAAGLTSELERMGSDAISIAADLRDSQECQRIVSEAHSWKGRIDILVNNASVFRRAPVAGAPETAWEAAWKESFEVNLLAPARLAYLSATALEKANGVIVNLLDIAVYQSWPGYAHYGACKAGLAWLTKTLAIALAPHVRSVGVAPGIAEFPADIEGPEQKKLISRVPLGRPGTPDDIARAVAYLVTADYVNGVIHVVDGGRLARSGEIDD